MKIIFVDEKTERERQRSLLKSLHEMREKISPLFPGDIEINYSTVSHQYRYYPYPQELFSVRHYYWDHALCVIPWKEQCRILMRGSLQYSDGYEYLFIEIYDTAIIPAFTKIFKDTYQQETGAEVIL